MFDIDEKSSFSINIKLYDVDTGGALATPVTSMTWWVGQPRNDTPILEKQTVATPSNDVTIIIPPEANICTSGRDEERFVIVRIATASHVKHKIFEYIINNLGLVPYPEE